MIAARGSSDNAARYGQYLFGIANGLPVALATPSLFTLYSAAPCLEQSLVVGISQSGQSPDIVTVVEEGRHQGALTVAITNSPDSPLASAAEYVLWLNAGEERSIAATKTYTASLLALAMLSTALREDLTRYRAIETVPESVSQALALRSTVMLAAQRYCYANACIVISRGYNYATAFEIALKLKELAYMLAEPYSSADFQHGPVALIERGFPVIGIVPEGQVREELVDFINRLKQQEAELIIVSACEEALALAQMRLPLPEGLPEWLSPLVAVVPGQLLSMGITVSKGLDPDHPRGLRKVTRTR